MRARIAAVLLMLWPALAGADIAQLKNGDQITGRTAAVRQKSYRVTTPYGRLLIPIDKIEKIVYDDGHEDVFLKKPPSGAADGLRMALVIPGDSFWQAWDPREAPDDPTLRFLVRVDGEPMAAYIDPQLD